MNPVFLQDFVHLLTVCYEACGEISFEQHRQGVCGLLYSCVLFWRDHWPSGHWDRHGTGTASIGNGTSASGGSIETDKPSIELCIGGSWCAERVSCRGIFLAPSFGLLSPDYQNLAPVLAPETRTNIAGLSQKSIIIKHLTFHMISSFLWNQYTYNIYIYRSDC